MNNVDEAVKKKMIRHVLNIFLCWLGARKVRNEKNKIYIVPKEVFTVCTSFV